MPFFANLAKNLLAKKICIQQDKDRSKEDSLTNELIIEIIKNINIFEDNYKVPIDMEFGVEKNILYIL